jgi:hypothetical protein
MTGNPEAINFLRNPPHELPRRIIFSTPRRVAPLVADLMVADCAELYVPAPGLNVGVATVMT